MWQTLRPLFRLDRSAARGDRLWCWNAPPSLTIPICLGRPRMSGGMTEGWRHWEREERRQNDGVAIKYTAGSEEHAGCCWAAALWWRISAPSLHFSSLFYFSATASELCLVCSPRFFFSVTLSRHSFILPTDSFYVFLLLLSCPPSVILTFPVFITSFLFVLYFSCFSVVTFNFQHLYFSLLFSCISCS